MRILVATDAWKPQVNGVVCTYLALLQQAAQLGSELIVVSPADFYSLPCPAYPGVRLAVPQPGRFGRIVEASQPDFIHIATEGPIGWMARRYCLRHGLDFTTSYHTKFPEYADSLMGVPQAWAYAAMRRFHAPSRGIMVATPSLLRDLHQRGFEHLMLWSRGVDTDLFRPRPRFRAASSPPLFLYTGRVSREKNIEAFLEADLPGRKVVVGDGPHLRELKARYRDVIFAGRKSGEELASFYAAADVFVFPSRTDTFGLVLLEAMASGLPVAAYPVTGPVDIVENGRSGILDEDLASAACRALTLDRSAARTRALQFTWRHAAELFLDNIRSVISARPGRQDAPGLKAFARPPVSHKSRLPETLKNERC